MAEQDAELKQMEEEAERHRVVCNVLYNTGAERSYEMSKEQGELLVGAFGEHCSENKYPSFTVNLGRLDIAKGEYKTADQLTVRFSGVLSIEIKEKEAQA